MSLGLGLDLGSSSTKALLWDTDESRALAKSQIFIQTKRFQKDGALFAEHDPEEIFQSVVKSIKEVIKNASRPASLSLGIASQRSSFLLLERKTLKALTPIVSWQDLRGQKIVEGLKNSSEIVYRKTGLAFNANYSLTKILWLLEENPTLGPRLAQGDVVFAPLPTYILLRLTRGRKFAVDPTVAQRSLLFNINDGAWDDELLKTFDLPKAMLPQIKNTTDDYGTVNSEFFGETIPIRAMIGDQQAALIALGKDSQNHALLNVGTGIFFLIPTGEKLAFIPGLSTSVLIQKENMKRFVLEGLLAIKDAAPSATADQFVLIAGLLQKENLLPKAMLASGGRAKNNNILQNLADILKFNIHVLEELDLTALGAAQLASGQLGGSQPPAIAETICPRQKAL